MKTKKTNRNAIIAAIDVEMMVYAAIVAILTVMAIINTATKEAEQDQQRQETIKRIKEAKTLDDLSAGVAYDLRFDSVELSQTEQYIKQQTEEQTQKESGNTAIETDGFVFYQIPEEYQKTGGELPEEVQRYIYDLCKEEGVRYALILAMIEKESGYKQDRIGDGGESVGYMQVMQKWHEQEMDEIGITNLNDPYENIRFGVCYMKKLINRYGTIQDALTVYNYGENGANEYLWSNGIYVYAYNTEIIQRMKEIEEELKQ